MNADEIEAMETQIRLAKAQLKARGEACWKQFRADRKYVWEVIQVDEYTFRVGVTYSPASLKRMAELDELYPDSYDRVSESNRGWMGMSYMLVGNVLIQAGGGWTVLRVPRTSSPLSWRELTDSEAAMLRNLEVPDSLKNPGFPTA